MKYHPGKSNSDADTLSRLPLNNEDYMATCSERGSLEVVQGNICSVQFQSQGDFPWLTDSITALDENHIFPTDQQH